MAVEVKGIGQSVGGNVPALGGARPRLECLLVEREEALEERAQNVVVHGAAREMRIERLYLGAIADVEHAGASAERDGGLAFRARGLREEREEDDKNAERKQEHGVERARRLPRGNPQQRARCGEFSVADERSPH